jgi:DNA sulfur modification protein DndC
MELIINFSGGKDSSAMLAYLCETYPDVPKRVIFANTGWEHPDAEAWSRSIVALFGLELHVVKNKNKTFLTMAANRGKFPGMQTRQCTSDLKRDPIQTWTRRNAQDSLIVNCMGIRAEESASRSKMRPLKRNKRMTKGGRTVWDWLPIHNWTEKQVLDYLEARNIPLHPCYQYLRRFSCRICIFMTQHDLRQVKKHDPQAVDIIADLERKINFTMFPAGGIETIINS